MTGFIDWLLHVGEHYPDLLAIILGTAGGYAMGLLAEAYAIPLTMDARHQKGLTVLITVIGSALMSTFIWHGLVPSDLLSLRFNVSLACAFLAPFLYPAVARLATNKWPAIGTVWSQSQSEPESKKP